MGIDWDQVRTEARANVAAKRMREKIPDTFTVSREKFLAALDKLGATRHGPERDRCVMRAWFVINGPLNSALQIELVFNTYFRVGGSCWYGRAGRWNEIEVDQYKTHILGRGARTNYEDGTRPFVRVHQMLWEATQ
jgi:hypothetical protein